MSEREPAEAPLDEAIDRYLRAKSKGADSGYYRNTASSALSQWRSWLARRDLDDFRALDDEANGPRIMRTYADRLARRVSTGNLRASSAQTYYDCISGFLSYAVRDGELHTNPARKARAREPLPEDERDARQQFWTPEVRSRFLAFLDERASDAIDRRGRDAFAAPRDRALVYVLAYTGVRGAEVLRSSTDDREGRQGLRWKNVDLDAGTLRIFGKDQRWETTPLPRQARPALERWRDVLRPPTLEWPVFPSNHAPTTYRVAREELSREHGLAEGEVEAVLEDASDATAVLREYEIPPTSLTVDAARKRVKSLSTEAGVEIDGEPLKLHGARRGIGDTIFRRDRGEAQDLLRHKSLETTKRAYSHIEAQERADRVSDILDGS